MKKNYRKVFGQVLIVLILVFGSYAVYDNYVYESNTVKVANWNLQIFGLTKASDADLMNLYADKISDYDIIFIQEIRDATQTSLPKLCAMLENYTCFSSSRAGRSDSKEQYGVIYRNGINVTLFTDFNPDPNDRWERPPIEVVFDINGHELIIYNIHTKPDKVKLELKALEEVIRDKGNVIILGDLNADCSYYDSADNAELDNLIWVVNDWEDTTASGTNCAYDRIIMNEEAYKKFVKYSVDKEGIDTNVSDHYIAWVEVAVDK